MNNEYVSLKAAIESLGIEKSELAHYVASDVLHPCFLCDVILVDYRKVDDHMGTIHDVEGQLFISGFIKPEKSKSVASSFNSQNDVVFYIGKAQLEKLISSQSNFRDEENERSWQIDKQKTYQISPKSSNFIDGKGFELHTSQCMFLTSEIDALKNSLSNATVTPVMQEHHELQPDNQLAILNFAKHIPNHESLSNIALFKPAALYALTELNVVCSDPADLKTDLYSGVKGIKSKVKRIFSKHPETQCLVCSTKSFNTYWTYLINNKLDEYDEKNK